MKPNSVLAGLARQHQVAAAEVYIKSTEVRRGKMRR